jgi:hypothetical protein
MPKEKQKKADRKKKAGKKTAQLAIRIEKAERDAFVALCEAQDTSAAREIRRFMRDYVAAHAETPAAAASENVESAPDVEPASAPEAAPKTPSARRSKAKTESAAPAEAAASAPEAAPKAPRARRSKAKVETAAEA